MRKNGYLFENAAICTLFGAIYYEMKGNMLQNAVRFAAKWKAKRHKNTLQWYK